jgi:hypothetical protein
MWTGTNVRRYYQRCNLLGWLLLALPALGSESFSVCHDFGCREETLVILDAEEWNSVRALFDAADAVEERQQIRFALGYMEYLAGRHSPLHRDVAGNLPSGASRLSELPPGQLDCIDESVNATRFLTLFQDTGLLRYHRVIGRAYRRSLFTQHWAAEIEDVATGRRFVYDTWFDDNGEPPVLVSSSRWHDLWFGGAGLNLTPWRRSTLTARHDRQQR